MRHSYVLLRSTLLLASFLATDCGGFFDNGDGPGGSPGQGERSGHHGRSHTGDCRDAGTPTEAAADASFFPDATIIVADSGAVADSGVPECVTSPDCPVSEQCSDGECTPCPDGICPCARDNDCPADQLCDHPAGICEPPFVACADVGDEPTCLSRTDCQSVYGGVDCRDANGGECTSQDPDCTCASFSFVACIDR